MGNGGRSKGHGKPRPPGRRLNRSPAPPKGPPLQGSLPIRHTIRPRNSRNPPAPPQTTKATGNSCTRSLKNPPCSQARRTSEGATPKKPGKDAPLLTKPRRPPRWGRRQDWGAKYERIFEALKYLYRHRGEGERFCSRLKARLKRALKYHLVDSADAFVKWLSLAMNIERIVIGKTGA
ncbi:MAG: hypothetical protein ACTSXX_07405 [Candidatus Baldrarchaeia archaeon]